MHIKISFIGCLVFYSSFVFAQSGDGLNQILNTRDSLLFEVGFNQCKTSVFNDLVAEDFEFYHDQSGVITDKDSFVKGISEGLCAMDYRAFREADRTSLKVFPLYDQGELYGALQTGSHRFYAIRQGEPRELTSTALFNHLWIIENGTWKLKRVISYNHIAQND